MQLISNCGVKSLPEEWSTLHHDQGCCENAFFLPKLKTAPRVKGQCHEIFGLRIYFQKTLSPVHHRHAWKEFKKLPDICVS
jgi:hypothetical protein